MPKPQYQSLQTIRKLGCLPAKGSLFLNGVSNKYQTRPPPLLKDIMSPKQLSKLQAYLQQLNYKTTQYWPCCLAYWLGYVAAPCTLGLSLLIPRLCVTQAEAVLLQEIKKINQDILGQYKLEMRLEKGCCDSFLVIEEVQFDQFEASAFDF